MIENSGKLNFYHQGWRVEYAGASDSYTACPQGFDEFYKQRRRWILSTILNSIDLISDWNNVVKKNDDISSPYLFYQAFNLILSIIGPGSIFLMLIGSFSSAFDLSNSTSMIVNLGLLGTFFLSCCFTKSTTQIQLAQV